MAQGIPILKDAPYNVLTVPNYVRSLVVTTAPGTIKAQYNPPDDPEATECWTTYKAGSYPEHPFDGKRVVTPLETPGVVDGNTRLLLHMNDMTDSSPVPKAVSSQGEVTFEDISGAYGGRAAHFSGTSYMTLDRSDDWAFPGDFTVDFRVYPLAWGGTSTNYNSLFVGTQSGGLVISREPSGSFGVSQYGSTAFLTCAIPPLNQWTHVAVCRSGTTVRVFYNGVLQAQAESNLSFAAQPIGIGGDGVGSYYNGYIDELRVSNTARWTADFEPPLAAYGSREPVAVTMTEGVENDTQYGVRVFIRGRLGFQTRKGGAQAMVTPVAGIPLGEWELGSLINVSRGGANCLWRKVSNSYNGNAEIIPLMLETITETWTITRDTYPDISLYDGIDTSWWERVNIRTYLNGDYYAGFDRPELIQLSSVPSCSYYGPGGSNSSGRKVNYTLDHVFLPSITEMDGSVHQAGLAEGIQCSYFTSNQSRIPSGAQNYRLRTGYPYATTGVYGKVNASGQVLGFQEPYVGETGIRPVICLPASTLISPEPNPDGSYSPIL